MKKIKIWINYKYNKLEKDIKRIIENDVVIKDSLFLSGLLIFIITNFIVNHIFGLYILSITLISLSIFLNKTKKAR